MAGFAFAAVVSAQPGPAEAEDSAKSPHAPHAIEETIAVLGLDALGVDSERVTRLESLFRMELSRLAGKPMLSRRAIESKLKRTKLARCGGETKCLVAIGQKLGVDLVVSGNVASLGDSYVVNIKVVDSKKEIELLRIASDPLRGESDELIEPIRVAAYRLLAPNEIEGAITILADIEGASVELDGKRVGTTPLSGPLENLDIGKHRLRVTASGYSEFDKEITVRFQKTSRVIVRLATPESGAENLGQPIVPPQKHDRWYNSTWFYVTVGVAAAAVGGTIGYLLARDDITDCPGDPACAP